MAIMFYKYYERLIDAGFDEEQAIFMVAEFQDSIVRQLD